MNARLGHLFLALAVPLLASCSQVVTVREAQLEGTLEAIQ